MPEIVVAIRSDADIVTARQRARALAARLGFSSADQVAITAAVSELARNILEYARQGEIILLEAAVDARRGLQVIAWDRGPGIADVGEVLKEGSAQGLGLGLAGTKRLMDDFEIATETGKGTRVTIRKWIR